MTPSHFKVKPREFDPTSYKYIFTKKHYEALAKHCAALLMVCNQSADAWKAVHMLSAMLEADNNKFKSALFLERIARLVGEAS